MRHRTCNFWWKRGDRLYFSEDKSSGLQRTRKCQEKNVYFTYYLAQIHFGHKLANIVLALTLKFFVH